MREKGFSIVEILVATALTGTVVLGVFLLLGPALKASSISNEMLVSSMLAQEGIELVINIRDTNWWRDGVPHDNNPVDWEENMGHPGNLSLQMGIVDYMISYNPADSTSGIIYAKDIEITGFSSENDFFNYENPMMGGKDTRLYIDNNNFYTHIPTTKLTQYRRIVKVEQDGGNNRLIITSTVRWGEPDDGSKQVQLKAYLYDWMQ